MSRTPENTAKTPMPELSNTPFFILGAPRSGTTLLRNMLRLHDRLACPEETHFFRWADAFGTERFERHYQGSNLFSRHRDMDDIPTIDFFLALHNSRTRKELADWYGERMLEIKGIPDGRWFDKTPQNSYGVLLLAEAYPDARFIHIHRNPLNVVASLKSGRVMPAHTLDAAINSWLEPVMILRQFRRIAAERIMDVSYETLVDAPRPLLEDIFQYIGECASGLPWAEISTHPEKNRYLDVLTASEIDRVLEQTEGYRQDLGYDRE